MDSILHLKEQLPAIREYVLKVLDENEDVCLYTNIGRLHRLEKNLNTITSHESVTEDVQHMVHLLLYVDLIQNATNRQTKFDINETLQLELEVVKDVCRLFTLPLEIQDRLSSAFRELMPDKEALLPEAKIFHDAMIMEFSGAVGRDNLKLLYQEMVLRGISMPQSNWYDAVIGMIDGRKAETSYGKEYIQPRIEKLTRKLKKEKKEIENRTSLLLKKELDISEKEIKKLRKNIKSAARRDERAIQTLFRTTIKNHYTLNEMVDRKANIMLTVNSIILSLLMSGIFVFDYELSMQSIPTVMLSITCIFSIIFAIFAIRPLKTQGDFTEEEIRNKEGNLLYFGNFHNMHLRDFEWGFLQLLNDKDYLYSSMIRDFYFQGVGLDRKYKFIRQSLNVFLYGFGISFLLFLLVRILNFT